MSSTTITASSCMARILYGLVSGRDMEPDRPLQRDREAGRVVLGGCGMPIGAPEWACLVRDEEGLTSLAP